DGSSRVGRAAPDLGAAAGLGGTGDTLDTGDTGDADSPLARAGEMGSPELGAALRSALPVEIYDAAHSRDSSLLLALALALDADPRTRAAQHSVLEAQLGPRRTERCAALREALDRLDPALRIPILELAVPALKQRPPEQRDYLFDLARKVGEGKGARRLVDYLLLRTLATYVAPAADRLSANGA